ncbi:NTP transferase domain-containing protein [Campylobacter sp. faydin G-140]|uniref:NTP transferase domain-containing protein n=1 Tax=Campylobacter anatolicus TaxID=2829105 RepID=UPI001B9D337A|nr:NTP transferase domain-containing protein [Campylobacter anatolicus]MBR8462232.1 NTP transferase domain-containing protein [Campylobacter anatolicus]MBR8465372.1 NTP transferase domain-containing protein [Campylobacter anatolicus]
MKNCVVLAGGKSSRMGRDKTLLPFGDFATLTHFNAHKLGNIFNNVYVSSKLDKFNPPLTLIKDLNDSDFSPMLAIFSILSQFKNENEHIFIIPADMPFVSENTIRELYKFRENFDMVIAQDDKYTHSLCGFFSPNLSIYAKELYEKGEHKIGLLRDLCKCKKVKFANSDEFFNVNNPSEYEEAVKRL